MELPTDFILFYILCKIIKRIRQTTMRNRVELINTNSISNIRQNMVILGVIKYTLFSLYEETEVNTTKKANLKTKYIR